MLVSWLMPLWLLRGAWVWRIKNVTIPLLGRSISPENWKVFISVLLVSGWVVKAIRPFLGMVALATSNFCRSFSCCSGVCLPPKSTTAGWRENKTIWWRHFLIFFCVDISFVNGNYSWNFHNDTMRATLWISCDRRADRQMYRTIHNAAWSQLKSKPFIWAFKHYKCCIKWMLTANPIEWDTDSTLIWNGCGWKIQFRTTHCVRGCFICLCRACLKTRYLDSVPRIFRHSRLGQGAAREQWGRHHASQGILTLQLQWHTGAWMFENVVWKLPAILAGSLHTTFSNAFLSETTIVVSVFMYDNDRIR